MDKQIIIAHNYCKQSYDNKILGYTKISDMRYGIFYTDDTIYIVIRGTDNLKNLLRDVWILPVESPQGYLCHAGFMSGYNLIIKEIGEELEYTKGVYNLVFTGHSYGGAVATLLCEQFGGKLITFGSPRVYFRFSAAPRLEHTRVIRDDDPVPKIPKLFYSHRTKPLVISDKDIELLDISDHTIDTYLEGESNG